MLWSFIEAGTPLDNINHETAAHAATTKRFRLDNRPTPPMENLTVAQNITSKAPKQVTETAAAIERYLSSRPQAAETVEGIARWWLRRQRFEDSVEMVQRALDLLVRRGVVEQLSLSGGQPMYRKAPGESSGEVRALM